MMRLKPASPAGSYERKHDGFTIIESEDRDERRARNLST